MLLKLAFHDSDTDILARILANTSDTRDFLKLFLWQAERHADILATILREDVDEDVRVGVGVVECELQRAQNPDSLLHFSKFLINVNFNLVTYYTLNNENVSIDKLSKRKCYQIFSHHSNTLLHYECTEKSNTPTNEWTPKILKISEPLGILTPSITLFLWLTRPTPQTAS